LGRLGVAGFADGNYLLYIQLMGTPKIFKNLPVILNRESDFIKYFNRRLN
jgi:hypothetical protein